VHDLDPEAAADVGGDHLDLLEVSSSRLATAARTLVGAWVEVWTRSRCSSASHRAWTPRPSSGVDADRSMSRRSSSVCGAAAMAAGYARLSGRIGACFLTTGPGATNALTSVAAVGLGFGIGFGAATRDMEAKARAAEFESDFLKLKQRAEANAIGANVSYGVAATAAVVAVVLWVTGN
jgi:hypothetical protein